MRLNEIDSKSSISCHAEGREGEGGVYVCTSFSSLPKDLIAEFAREAQSRKVYPRDLFSDAVMLLCQQREQVEITYLVPRSGGVKKTIWLSEKALEIVHSVAQKDNVKNNVVFLTSLKLYAEKEGLNVKI